MQIIEIISHETQEFSGIFQVLSPNRGVANNGSHFIHFWLKDRTGAIYSFAWKNKYTGPEDIPEGKWVKAKGKVKSLNGIWIAHIIWAEILPEEDASLMLQDSDPIHLDSRIQDIVNDLSLTPLKDFVYTVLSDPSIAPRFEIIPASKKNHHSTHKGLIQHSIECAQFVAKVSFGFDCFEKEIGIVAALFHDIGKIKTHQYDGRRTNTGWLVHHDHLTLEVLAKHLAALDSESEEIANALRYVLSWLGSQRSTPLLVIAKVVLLADQISSYSSSRSLAFRGQPHSYNFAKFQGRWYFRPQQNQRQPELS